MWSLPRKRYRAEKNPLKFKQHQVCSFKLRIFYTYKARCTCIYITVSYAIQAWYIQEIIKKGNWTTLSKPLLTESLPIKAVLFVLSVRAEWNWKYMDSPVLDAYFFVINMPSWLTDSCKADQLHFPFISSLRRRNSLCWAGRKHFWIKKWVDVNM